MNLTFILLLILLFGGGRTAEIRNFLARVDFKSFAPVLKLMGVSDKTIEYLSSENFEKLMEGNGDLKSALPAFLSAFKKETPAATGEENGETEGDKPIKNNYLDPIKDLAANEALSSLGAYFT